MRALFTGPFHERYATLNTIQKAAVTSAVRGRKSAEQWLEPDEHLDELGWQIFDIAVRMDMRPEDCATIAMDGNLRQRSRVLDDMWKRWIYHLRLQFPELRRPLPDTTDRLAYWRDHLAEPSFVYFVQAGDHGPVKIGKAKDPEKRIATLQTGSHVELKLRDVVPGDSTVETMMHHRFAAARIRGEWFGAEYLPLVLAYADALASEAVLAHDGGKYAPDVSERGSRVLDVDEREYLRREIERLWRTGHEAAEIACYLGLLPDDVEGHMSEMRKSTLYDLRYRNVPQRYPARRQRRAA